MYSEDILKFINSFYMKRTGKRVKGLNVIDLYFQEEALIHVDKRSHHFLVSFFICNSASFGTDNWQDLQ